MIQLDTLLDLPVFMKIEKGNDSLLSKISIWNISFHILISKSKTTSSMFIHYYIKESFLTVAHWNSLKSLAGWVTECWDTYVVRNLAAASKSLAKYYLVYSARVGLVT